MLITVNELRFLRHAGNAVIFAFASENSQSIYSDVRRAASVRKETDLKPASLQEGRDHAASIADNG